ncbi:uncharacterized protein LOC132299400 isoform X2 [Cornus florida]|uniref:uncharacterized protein LOC132299400 isoform X2 n=1 Tax=Cornus florida TaxID=4283 RepID=UPI0028A24E2F|nr:uncharacterized protein LOC132299400 isoform X2 [Cornus florida]
MATVPQSSWLCSLRPIKGGGSSTSGNPRHCTFKTLKVSSSSNAESSSPNSSNSPENYPEDEPAETDPVKIALAKAKAYKKSKPTSRVDQNAVPETAEIANRIDGSSSEGGNGGNQELPVAVKLAMEKAKEYKKNKGIMGGTKSVERTETISGLNGGNGGNSGNEFGEKRVVKKEEPKISSIDFMGLGFSDKKQSRGLPAGLVPVADPFSVGDLPEVEIIVGDTSKFDDATVSEPKPTQEDNSDLYKPKVSTWGVFPRPSNISKSYGGGRVICPGEVLEKAEDKAAKDERTRKLVAAYKSQIGLNIDPKLKTECEKSEIHGLAALQWSICQDSLSRANEAQVMYERLQSHPNVKVSKKARQFMFGFQAMEMMKVRDSYLSPLKMGYQNFFEAFLEDKSNYPLKEPEVKEGELDQALPYIIFLASPILIILLIAVRKGI